MTQSRSLERGRGASSGRGITREDWAYAGLLALVLGVVYSLCPQPWLWGDGYGLSQGLHAADSESRFGLHVAYQSSARLLQSLVWGLTDYQALHLTSAWSCALGLAAAFVFVRLQGSGRLPGFLATVLVAVSPSVWFFGTAIEVHATHMAAVCVGAVLTWLLPWRSFALGVGLCSLILAALPLTHLSAPLLGPAWVLYASIAASRARGVRLRLGQVAVLAVALLFAVIVGMQIAQYVRGVSSGANVVESVWAQIVNFPGVPGWHWWRDDVVLAFGFVWVLAVVGAVGSRRQVWKGLTIAAAVAPQLAFHGWWGVPNLGGYFLALVPVLCLLTAEALVLIFAARGWRRGLALALVPVLVGGQVVLALDYARNAMGTHELVDRSGRVEQVRRAIGERGVLVSFDPGLQSISRELPGVRDCSFVLFAAALPGSGLPASDVAEDWGDRVAVLLEGADGQLAWDASYRRFLPAAPVLSVYMLAVEAELARRFHVETLEHSDWPMLLIRRR